MSNKSDIFLFVSGAASCRQTPELIRALLAAQFTVYSVLTPNVVQVMAPAPLMEVPGNHWIHSYQQDPLDRFPFGSLLVAPCTFNTFNKIALGLADNLATSMIADGLGAGRPVTIAPSMNHGLWTHPQTKESLTRLQDWGCSIVLPEITDQQVTMAPLHNIMQAVQSSRVVDGN